MRYHDSNNLRFQNGKDSVWENCTHWSRTPKKPLSFPFTKNSRISNSNPVSNLPQLSDDEENNWNCQMQLYHIDSVIDLYIHRNISRKINVSKG